MLKSLESEAERRKAVPDLLARTLTGFGRGLAMGVIIGVPVVLIVRIAVLEVSEEVPFHRGTYLFEELPASDQHLLAVLDAGHAVDDVFIARNGRTLVVSYRAPQTVKLDWERLGYRGLLRERVNVDVISDPFDPHLFVYLFLLARSADVGFLIVSFRRLRRARSAGEIIPNLFRGRAKPALTLGLLGGLAVTGVLVGTDALLREAFGVRPATFMFWSEAGELPDWSFGLILAAIVLLQPIAQESFFRGVAFGSLLGATRPLLGAILSGALYALAQLDPVMLPAWFVIGLILSFLYRRSNSLLAPLAAAFLAVLLTALVA